MDAAIQVDRRAVTGKAAGRLRRQGIVPGVVFGKGSDSIPVQVDERTLESLYRSAGKTTVLQLSLPGDGRGKSAIIKNLQRDPVSRRAIHVDFFLVDMRQEMQADVPLVFIGHAPAVDLTGGTLLTSLDHLKIRALPGDIPHQIEVDVSGLTEPASTIHVSDIAVDGGKVHVLNEGDELIAKIAAASVEEEVAPTGLEEAVEGPAPADDTETDTTTPPAE